ncbi:MAG: phosphomannomutase [Candidatus Malacoplasma girerdii]|nr:MAG: phosphomannomutase [Candidatus Malacoplasma girerdii]
MKSKENKIYLEWINSPNVCSNAKALIEKMSDDEINSYFSNEKMHFGTAGIRGTMGPGTHQMNCFTYQQMTVGFAKYLTKKFKNPSVVVGHDNRNKSDVFALTCAKVLTDFGIKVYLFHHNELVPTPFISFAIRQLNASGGIICTASHNPKEYNGFKVYNPDGGQILPEVANLIEEYMPDPAGITNLDYQGNNKLIHYIDLNLMQQYFEACKKVFINKSVLHSKKEHPIIFTAHHGTASYYLPEFLNQCGFNIISVKEQCFPDSTFKNSPSANPEFFDSFKLSIEYANKYHSDICIGVDPDADRMAVLVKHNNQWRLMTGNEMGIIYVYYTFKHKKFQRQPFMVASHVSTNYINLIAKDYNAVVMRSGTGFKWMGKFVSDNDNKMDFVIAFEEAIGALNTNINRDKDSFTASALALEIYDYCRKQNLTLVDYLEKIIFGQYGSWFGYTDSFWISGLDWKNKAIEKMNFFKQYKEKNIGPYTIQSIKWNDAGDCLEWDLGSNNWIKFRTSGTEPKFKAYYNFYGNSVVELRKIYQDIHNQFAKIIN